MINEKIKETSVSRLFLHNFLRATGGLSSKRGKKNERFLSLNKQSVLPLLPCFLFFFPFFKFFHPKKEDRLTKKREQKTQSETALARTRANTGQALNGDNQTKTIFSRLIFDRSIYVPRSRPVRNRTHKQERRIIITGFLPISSLVFSPPFLSPAKNRRQIALKKKSNHFSENEMATTYAQRQLARERRFSRRPWKISSKKSSAQRQRGLKIE
jgi:hypothetical protein